MQVEIACLQNCHMAGAQNATMESRNKNSDAHTVTRKLREFTARPDHPFIKRKLDRFWVSLLAN